ncbi:MAG TPA: hypothetical protein PKX92_10620 [Edaphocola sp.]|nr:hypothetical protein [Edaphocola sp.]
MKFSNKPYFNYKNRNLVFLMIILLLLVMAIGVVWVYYGFEISKLENKEKILNQ